MLGWVIPALFVLLAGTAVAAFVLGERRLADQGYRRDAPLPTTPAPPALAPTAARFTGGARLGRANATWPLGRLELDGQQANVRASGLARFGRTGSVWIARSEVDEVRPVHLPMGNGVRFASAAGTYDAVVFWTGFTADSIDPVLAAFRDRGWPVAD